MINAMRTETSLSQRVDALDWPACTEKLNQYGAALASQVLTPDECAEVTALYNQRELFRSTINMERYRFGAGEYRYFDRPFADVIQQLRTAFYPHLLPIARDWAAKLGRPAPWPDTLEEWLSMCHAAGQTKPTPILLRYETGDWNALHRDLYGDLVFPLQVVIGLNKREVDYSGGEFLVVEQ